MGMIDRLVARHDVASRYGPSFAASSLAVTCSAFALPLIVVTRSKLALFLPLGCMALLFLYLTLTAVRSYHRATQPYASPRWMTALHQVFGTEVMSSALRDLARRRRPDYLLRRDELIEMIGVHLSRRKRALAADKGVRLDQAANL